MVKVNPGCKKAMNFGHLEREQPQPVLRGTYDHHGILTTHPNWDDPPRMRENSKIQRQDSVHNPVLAIHHVDSTNFHPDLRDRLVWSVWGMLGRRSWEMRKKPSVSLF